MKIEKLFKKDINRDIQGVVTIGNEEESRKKQELEEYVCTQEVIKNFRTFFSAYKKSISQPTEQVGSWITGFFGSGKSHFLKILGYLLSNEIVDGKHAVEYFDEKIKDEMIKADMQLSANQNNLVVLFNIDAKAKSDAKNKNVSIMETMLGAFNEKLGYFGVTPWLAEFERNLDNEGLYDSFKEKFSQKTGKVWIDSRRVALIFTDKIAEVLSELKGISMESAKAYIQDAQKNYSLSIEEFSRIVAEYIKKTGRRVVFLIDEVGQFIGTRGELMLGLQTVEEELGKACKGKAWIVVTSQQEIKELVESANRNAQNDFSKIQGRFPVRLMMSSSNADEVIKKRLLDKTDDSANMLGALYTENKDRLNNLLIFPQKPKWTGYENEKQFIDCYPFVNYQFELLQLTFTAIRESGMSEGKHISSGERSLMNAFQKSAISKKDREIGELIPFNAFYETIEEFMDHDIKKIFASAERRLSNPFDIEVLKVLFMLKNVKDMEPTLERISTLMVTHINQDKKELKDRIKESLERLIGETLAQKNGERYEFLTNKEQDVNREINKAQYSTSEVINKIREIIFDNVVEIGNKFTYGKYQFNLNRYVDDNIQGTDSQDNLTIKIYTPWTKNEKDLRVESMSGALVVDLTNGAYLEELIQANRIQTFDRNNASGADSVLIDILTKKRAEAEERIKRAEKNIRSSIEDCSIYQNGSEIVSSSKDAKKRILEGLEKVLKNKYHKIDYVKNFINKAEDISVILRNPQQSMFDDIFSTDSNGLALKEVFDFIKDEKTWQRKVTMSSLTTKFGKAPFGYRANDVRGLVATLLHAEKFKAKISDQLQNIHSQNFIWEFSHGSQDERIVIEIQTEVDPQILMKVKRVMKDAFDVTINNKENDLRDESLQFFKTKIDDLRKISYGQQGQYPGKSLVEEMLSVFATITSSSDSETVFNKIISKENDLNRFGGKIDSIIAFYNQAGSQMKTWNAAKDIYSYYRENQLFIPELEDMSDLIGEITDILGMDEPFNSIAKLGTLVQQANEIKNGLLGKKVEIAKKTINDSLDLITKEYIEAMNKTYSKEETKESIETLYQSEKTLYSNLLGMLDTFDKISSSEMKAVQEVNTFRTELAKIIAADGGVKPLKKVNVKASNLIPVANRKITSKDDIDHLVENIKTYLESLLKDNEEVDID